MSFHFVPVALGSWEGPGGDLGSSGEGRLLAGRVSLRDPLPTLPQFQKLGVLVLSNSSIRDWGGPLTVSFTENSPHVSLGWELRPAGSSRGLPRATQGLGGSPWTLSLVGSLWAGCSSGSVEGPGAVDLGEG